MLQFESNRSDVCTLFLHFGEKIPMVFDTINGEKIAKLCRIVANDPYFVNEFLDVVSQIETNVTQRIKLSNIVGKIPHFDPEHSPEYWEAVREIVKLGKEKSVVLQDPKKFSEFLKDAQKHLSVLVSEEKKRGLIEEAFEEIIIVYDNLFSSELREKLRILREEED